MSYFKLQYSKVLRNKVNIFSIALFLLIICISLFMNHQVKEDLSLEGLLASENQNMQEQFVLDNSESQQFGVNKEMLDESIELNQSIIKLLEDKQKIEAYQLMLSKLENQIALIEENKDIYGEEYHSIVDPLLKNEAYYQYLIDHSIKADNSHPIQASNFMFSMWTTVIPYMLVLLMIFIFTSLFSQNYYKGLKVYILKPISFGKRLMVDIAVAFTFSILGLLILLSFAYVICGIFGGWGSFSYPTLNFNHDGSWQYQPLLNALIPAIILQLLFMFAVIITVYFITILFKDKNKTFIISTIVIFGSLGLIFLSQFVRPYAAFIPFAYINPISVITGQMNQTFEGLELSFETGLYSLISYIVLMILGLLTIEGMTRKIVS